MGKVLAGVFAVLFVIITVLVLLLISVDGVLLDAATYKRALVEQKAYEQGSALAAVQVGGTPSVPGVGSGQMAFLSLLTPADWNLLLSTLLPPADLQKMTEDGLDQVFSYLNGDTDSARISLVALKQRVAGPAGQEAIKLVLTSQPPCTLEQLTQLALSIFKGSGALIMCQPPAEMLGVAVSIVQSSMQAVVAPIPDEVEIMKPASSSVPATGGGPLGNDPRALIRTVRAAAWLSPLVPIGLLLLVALLGVRSLKGWLRWWGIPMFIAGLIAFAAAPVLDWAWVNYVAVRIPSLVSSSISEAAHDLLNSIARQLSNRIMLDAGLVILLGFGATVVSVSIDKRACAPPRTPS
jgi:hypothetical protein